MSQNFNVMPKKVKESIRRKIQSVKNENKETVKAKIRTILDEYDMYDETVLRRMMKRYYYEEVQ